MELDASTLIAIALFVAGIVYARWERGGQQHTKAVQVDTQLQERVKHLEEKVREQGDHGKSITRLEVLFHGMARDMHELRMWAMEQRMQQPLHLRQQVRSPYDFPGARAWVRPGEEDDWGPPRGGQ